MKYILSILFLFCSFWVWSQEIISETKSIEKIDSFYYLVSTTEIDNNTDYPDTIKTRSLLGDSLTAVNRVFSDAIEDQQKIAGAVRRAFDLQSSNSRWTDYNNLYGSITGADLDDAAEDVYKIDFLGSCRVSVPVSLLTETNVTEISTTDLATIIASGDSRVSFPGEFYLTGAGNLRLRNLDTSSTWGCNTKGPRHFEVRQIVDDNYDFYFENKTSTRLRFSTPIAITDRSSAIIINLR